MSKQRSLLSKPRLLKQGTLISKRWLLMSKQRSLLSKPRISYNYGWCSGYQFLYLPYNGRYQKNLNTTNRTSSKVMIIWKI